MPDHFIYDLQERIADIESAGGLHLEGLKQDQTDESQAQHQRY